METKTLTLSEFLLARIGEDEADPWRGAELIGSDRIVGKAEADALAAEEREWEARVLAECEAKRRIVEAAERPGDRPGEAVMQFVLRMLARPYADHPDYRDEWRP